MIHTGDTVTAGYPIVDVDSGGQFEGFIAAADRILALADDNTKIIPGHGPLMTKADLVAYRQMLIDVRDRIGKLLAAKKTARRDQGRQAARRSRRQVGPGFRQGRPRDRARRQDACCDPRSGRKGAREAQEVAAQE